MSIVIPVCIIGDVSVMLNLIIGFRNDLQSILWGSGQGVDV